MPPSPLREHSSSKPKKDDSSSLYMSRLKHLYVSLSNVKYDVPFMVWLILCEMVLCFAIIQFVKYTEIDWIAYMQEVTTWQEGELDYVQIRGDTGPLVYPAGFLCLYGALQHFTDNGTNIYKAQVVFAYIYLTTTALALFLYKACLRRRVVALATVRASTTTTTTTTANNGSDSLQTAHVVWSWRIAMVLCCVSKRIHSIHVLRLFNDAPTMMLLHVSLALFSRNQWRIGCLVYSTAVSIKMNVLLFAPGLLLLLLQANSISETIINLSICALVQIVLGAPFLLTYPVSYLRKAFELDRVFVYKWTVNWKFLDEQVFVSKQLSVLLLVLHLSCLAALCIKWIRASRQQDGVGFAVGGHSSLSSSSSPGTKRRRVVLLTPEYVVYTLAVSNFCGICFARTLHYQFYVWYFHSIGILLWISAAFPIHVRILLVACVEYAFDVYPATATSSVILQLAHLAILTSIAVAPVPQMVLGKAGSTEAASAAAASGEKPKEE